MKVSTDLVLQLRPASPVRREQQALRSGPVRARQVRRHSGPVQARPGRQAASAELHPSVPERARLAASWYRWTELTTLLKRPVASELD